MLQLTKAIILDNKEYVPAGTILYNYGKHSLYSVAPSKKSSYPSKIRSKIDKDCIIDFCRIPRECVDFENLSKNLKRSFVKGDNSVSPFYCSIIGKRIAEERHITELPHIEYVMYGDRVREYYDAKFGPINVVLISSMGELTIGAHSQYDALPQIDHDLASTVILFYYSGSANLKLKKVAYNKFYAGFRAYRTVIDFSELSIGDRVDCYEIIDNKAIFENEVHVIDMGHGQEWLEKFHRAHSSMNAFDEGCPEDDLHMFVRLCHYDKECSENVSELKMLHQSSCHYIFSRRPVMLKTLIKECGRLL